MHGISTSMKGRLERNVNNDRKITVASKIITRNENCWNQIFRPTDLVFGWAGDAGDA